LLQGLAADYSLERLIIMTTREMFEAIEENAPHIEAIRCALNAINAAARQARDVYNCTNESEYFDDAVECEKLAAAIDALYSGITHREGCHLQASATKKCPFEGDKPEDIWVTKRWDGE
jgi:hypothetical protein